MKHAYILDPDEARRKTISSHLTHLSCHMEEHSDLLENYRAMDLNGHPILVLSLEQNHPCTGLCYLLFLKKHHPQVTVILLVEECSDALSQLVQWNGAYVLRYDQLKELRKLTIRIVSYLNELRFQLEGISLFDMVQMVSLSQARADIYVQDDVGGIESMICFEQGRIKHALSGELSGENALFQIMNIQKGYFSEALDVPELIYSIESETASLLARSALSQDHVNTPSVSMIIADTQTELEDLIERNFSGRVDMFTVEKDILADLVQYQSYDVMAFHLEEAADIELAISLAGCAKKLIVYSRTNIQPTEAQMKAMKADVFFLFPVQMQQFLAWIQHGFFEQSFTGELLNMSLFDALQVLGMSSWPRKIECFDAFRGEVGEMYRANGMILKASFGELKGMEALDYWTRIKVGHMVIEETEYLLDADLNLPIQGLLMNMAVNLDQNALIPEVIQISENNSVSPQPKALLEVLGPVKKVVAALAS